MTTPADISAPVSFGFDVRRPRSLETCSTNDVLLGIQSGAWQNTVARVRSLPPDSTEQKAAKLALPYATWAGVFSHRANTGLVRHSGQIGVDLDDLGEAAAIALLQTAVADRFCLAAFRSARGEGVRLIFRIPPCSPENHAAAFEQVAEHVRNTYGRDADESGKDVCRASFVSFDRGLWFNPSADVLPIVLPDVTQRLKGFSRCVPSLYGGELALTCWNWFGQHFANTAPVSGETAKTHGALLALGKAIALHAERIREPLTARQIDSAFESWLREHNRQGVRLRCSADEYRRELRDNIEGARRKSWFKSAAEKWIRWTRHKEFPHDALPHEKILFAVRQHCANAGSDKFFLGARDAGLVAGGSFRTAARAIRKLCDDGHLEKTSERRQPRHAQTYRLIARRTFYNDNT
jgi:BT4734-like, N-terminal domain